MAPLATSAAELTARLLTLIRRIPNRGADALFAEPPAWELAEVLKAVDALEPLDPAARDGWMYAPAFQSGGGKRGSSKPPWVLRFTSSRTFHLNEGLLGYAKPSVATPERWSIGRAVVSGAWSAVGVKVPLVKGRVCGSVCILAGVRVLCLGRTRERGGSGGKLPKW